MKQALSEPLQKDLVLPIRGMRCAGCATRIERTLMESAGISAAAVNLTGDSATISFDPALLTAERIASLVRQQGFAVPWDEWTSHTSSLQWRRQRETTSQTTSRSDLLGLIICGSLTLPLILPMLLWPLGIGFVWPGWVQFLLATPVQFYFGGTFYRGAWSSLKNRSATMDTLVTLGTSAAFGLSTYRLIAGGELYFESAAAIVLFVRLGKWFESRAKRSARDAIQALSQLQPTTVRVIRDESESHIPVEDAKVGNTISIRPGERVPLDGVIVEGESELDESLITGEATPVFRGPKEHVVAGALNGSGGLLVELTRVGDQTTLSQIAQLIEQAQASKAPVQWVIDRITAVFVPAVLLIAAGTVTAWLLMGAPFDQAIVNGVSVLVIACPCALGLAIPAALTVSTGAAAQTGFLVRDAEALERAASIETVFFDKTGTLTEGKPRVCEILSDDPTRLLELAVQVQASSEHPLAEAVRAEARARKIRFTAAEGFRAKPGRGVRGRVNGMVVKIGSRRYRDEHGLRESAWDQRAADLENEGTSVSWVFLEEEVIGAFATKDHLRPTTVDAVRRLHERRVSTILLTGDTEASARSVAHQAGIEKVVTEALPAEKATTLETERSRVGAVAMIGDGINDGPALAAADVGFAIGTGSDLAKSTASVTLIRPDLRLIASTISLSKATRTKIRQNLFWAFVFNSAGLPLAASGLLTPMFAGAAMALSSVTVLGNALLLKRWRPEA